jgi:hypothetical protein
MLRRITEHLFTFDRPFRWYGVNIGTRMSVIVLPSGGLLLHSPVRFGTDLRDALAPLGPVEHLFAPCKTHHLALPSWLEAYPNAKLHGAPGLKKKRPDLRWASVLTDEVDQAWAAVCKQHVVVGLPQFHEVALLHQPSRTLLLADTLFGGYAEETPFPFSVVARALGLYEQWGFPRLGQLGKVHDAAALKNSIDLILSWDFDRIVISHGAIVESGGKDVLRRAYEARLSRA